MVAGDAGYIVAAPRSPLSTLVVAGGIAIASALLAIANPPMAGAIILFLIVALFALNDVRAGVYAFIVIAPWTTVANILAGGRWVALGTDALLILFAATVVALVRNEDLTPTIRRIGIAWFAFLVLGLAGMLNPRGLGLLGDLEGYRAMFLPMLALPVGYVLARRSASFENNAAAAVVAATVVVALMGIRQVIELSPLEEAIIENAKSDILPFTATGTNRFRAFSPLPGPFHFGFLMMIAITLVLSAAMARVRAWHGVVLALLIVALGLNATRLNWSGTAFAIATVVLLSLSPRHLPRLLARIAVIVIIGILALRTLSNLQIFSPIRNFAAEFLTNPLANSSYTGRVLGWFTEIFPAIQAAPVFGYGTGMAKDALGPFTSHNLLLKILIEGGVLLLVAYVATTVLILAAIWRRRTSPLTRAAIALMVGMHAAGMFAPILDALPGNEYYWLLLGVALAGTVSASHNEARRQSEVALPPDGQPV